MGEGKEVKFDSAEFAWLLVQVFTRRPDIVRMIQEEIQRIKRESELNALVEAAKKYG